VLPASAHLVQANRHERANQSDAGHDEIIEAFGQRILEVGWSDLAHDRRSGVRAGQQYEAFLLNYTPFTSVPENPLD